jgi:hypothetical protein
MRHPVYIVRRRVIPINSSLFTVILEHVVGTTLSFNDATFPFITLQSSSTVGKHNLAVR